MSRMTPWHGQRVLGRSGAALDAEVVGADRRHLVPVEPFAAVDSEPGSDFMYSRPIRLEEEPGATGPERTMSPEPMVTPSRRRRSRSAGVIACRLEPLHALERGDVGAARPAR